MGKLQITPLKFGDIYSLKFGLKLLKSWSGKAFGEDVCKIIFVVQP